MSHVPIGPEDIVLGTPVTGEVIPAEAQRVGLRSILESKIDSIADMVPISDAAQRTGLATRIVRATLFYVSQKPELRAARPLSVINCAMKCAQFQLVPGSNLNLAHIVAFGGEAQLIIGYRGCIEMARRTGLFVDVVVGDVHEGDEFTAWKGTAPEIKHRVSPTVNRSDKATLIATYCAWRMTGSTHWNYELLDKASIERRRKVNPHQKVWDAHYVAMARKSAVHAAAKCWPVTPELAALIEDDTDESADPDARMSRGAVVEAAIAASRVALDAGADAVVESGKMGSD